MKTTAKAVVNRAHIVYRAAELALMGMLERRVSFESSAMLEARMRRDNALVHYEGTVREYNESSGRRSTGEEIVAEYSREQLQAASEAFDREGNGTDAARARGFIAEDTLSVLVPTPTPSPSPSVTPEPTPTPSPSPVGAPQGQYCLASTVCQQGLTCQGPAPFTCEPCPVGYFWEPSQGSPSGVCAIDYAQLGQPCGDAHLAPCDPSLVCSAPGDGMPNGVCEARS